MPLSEWSQELSTDTHRKQQAPEWLRRSLKERDKWRGMWRSHTCNISCSIVKHEVTCGASTDARSAHSVTHDKIDPRIERPPRSPGWLKTIRLAASGIELPTYGSSEREPLVRQLQSEI